MKRLLKNILAKLGYQVQGTRYTPRLLLDPRFLRTVEFDDVVCRRMIAFGPELRFVQIGAYDGVIGDPLYKYIDRYGWRGVLVEPQSRVAAKLRELYRDNDGIVVVQAALGATRETRTLFAVESESAPEWAGGLASFDRDTIIKHADLIPGLETMIREEAVDCIPFEDVLKRLPSERVDLLQIDTEGADAYVLSLFPFDRVRPSIVHWEVKHLDKARREECLERLATLGYRFANSGDEDMLAVQSW